MLYDWTSTAALGVVRDIQPKEPLTLTGEGLWVSLISSGRCTASLTDASPSPAGSALILPPQSAAAGHLVLSRAPLTLTPEGESHLLCIQLTGQAAVQFLAGLTELQFLARGETCPAAAELLGRLAAEADTPRSRAASQLAFALLCELAGADSAAPPPRRAFHRRIEGFEIDGKIGPVRHPRRPLSAAIIPLAAVSGQEFFEYLFDFHAEEKPSTRKAFMAAPRNSASRFGERFFVKPRFET